ncbi:MAG: EAL domain-containing protein [Firmicutes bacterium]|nr:EAL domain-containing protein [Bacillota bacterium]
MGEVFWHYYDQELALAMERRAYILENFDRAIRNGWIHVYYQPVMRTLTGKLCGMEALARWEDPVYGLMPPALFYSCSGRKSADP